MFGFSQYGDKTDARWMTLRTMAGNGLLFRSTKPFSFSALHYSTDDLDQLTKQNFRHTTDMMSRPETFVNIDLMQMGVGGDNSWGAQPLEQYRMPAKNYSFSFQFRPYQEGEDPFELWQEVY